MKKLLSSYITVVVFCLTANNVLAERVQWKVQDGGNGHYYEGFDASVTWSEANKLAKALGGHLATITSDAENKWVFDNVGKPFYLLGGTDALEEGKWTWVTKEEWVYDNWDSGQPDNFRGNENFLHYHSPYVWNDIRANSKEKGFIVEYELKPSKAKTCQPATLSNDLKLHIPLLDYSPFTNMLSVDMEMIDSSKLLFKVINYRAIK